MRKAVYRSCNCQYCRHWPPSNIRGEYKKAAHRELRHKTRLAIAVHDWERIPEYVSNGPIV